MIISSVLQTINFILAPLSLESNCKKTNKSNTQKLTSHITLVGSMGICVCVGGCTLCVSVPGGLSAACYMCV